MIKALYTETVAVRDEFNVSRESRERERDSITNFTEGGRVIARIIAACVPLKRTFGLLRIAAILRSGIMHILR